MASRLDTLLQSSTYQHLRMLDYTLDDAQLESRCPLDYGRHLASSSASSSASLGALDRLPPELVVSLLLSLDLKSLTTFRRVSRASMALVSSIHEYAQVARHCPNVLRAILALRATSYSCRTLYATLSTTACSSPSCQLFGAYLYLITCRRACYFCFTSAPDFFPLTHYGAFKNAGVTTEQLQGLPYVFALPGCYTAGRRPSSSVVVLFDRCAVIDSAAAAAARTHTPFGGRVEPQDFQRHEAMRFMAVVSAPYFDPAQRGEPCWGFYCARCRAGRDCGTYRVKYSRQGIVEHLRSHGPTRKVNGP